MADPQEELQFNVGDNEEEATVEMNEDGTEAKVASEEAAPAVEEEKTEETTESTASEEKAPTSDELDNVHDKTKKRINKLTARLREAERREKSAVEYAKAIQTQHEELKQQYQQTSTERIGEAKGRVETQITALKSVIKRAREEGDIDTETEAQQRLTTALYEQQQLAAQGTEPAPAPAPVNQPAPAPAPEAAPRQSDPKAEQWAEENPWFGKDVVMTNTVRGVHMELVQNQGFDPTSDEYYDEVNRTMRELFPRRFQASGEEESAPSNRTNRNVQTVAPATRSSGINNSARRTVKLKPSEVAIAKSLGVPLEEYAKYVKR